MIYFSKFATDVKVLGNKLNRYIISSKTTNFNATIFNVVIFFQI